MTFQIDTSGYVQCPAPDQKPNESTGCWFWSDLSPFTQGYIEALLTGANADTRLLGRLYKDLGFSDLAPETLARIIADCDYAMSVERGHDRHVSNSTDKGSALWRKRQSPLEGGTPEPAYGLPPQTVQPGDDGRVRFA